MTVETGENGCYSLARISCRLAETTQDARETSCTDRRSRLARLFGPAAAIPMNRDRKSADRATPAPALEGQLALPLCPAPSLAPPITKFALSNDGRSVPATGLHHRSRAFAATEYGFAKRLCPGAVSREPSPFAAGEGFRPPRFRSRYDLASDQKKNRTRRAPGSPHHRRAARATASSAGSKLPRRQCRQMPPSNRA